MILDKIKVASVVGTTGSGKTALVFSFLDYYKKQGKDVYILRHPNPKLIEAQGFKNLYSIEDIQSMKDLVLFIDEPQLLLPSYKKRNNDLMLNLFSLVRQRDIKLILATSNTRYINKGIESYVDTWVIKDIDYETTKNGSTIKHIISENALIDPRGFRLKVEEYLIYNRQFPALSGKQTFKLPSYFNDDWSKPYGDDL